MDERDDRDRERVRERGREGTDERRVQSALTELHLVRRRCIDARERGDLTSEDVLEMQVVMLDCIECLRPWRERCEWEDAGPDWIRLGELHQHLGSVTVEEEQAVGLGRTRRVTETKPRVLDWETLLSVARGIEDCAEQIGLEDGPERVPGSVHGGIL